MRARVYGRCTRQRWSRPAPEVLEIFRRRQLYAKSSRCEFGRREFGFRGDGLSAASVSEDPRKVQSIVEWATPTSPRRAASRGSPAATAVYIMEYVFIDNHGDINSNAFSLLTWTAAAQASFDALKRALSSAPVLRTLDPARRRC